MTRSGVITFKASDKERAILSAIAAKEDRTISEMLRELVREGAINRGLTTVGNIQLMSKYEAKPAAEKLPVAPTPPAPPRCECGREMTTTVTWNRPVHGEEFDL